MTRRLLPALLLLAIALAAFWLLRRTHDPLPGFPATMLYAPDRGEDLRFLDPRITGVAFLARTVVLGDTGISILPRMSALQCPQGTVQMAVVQIEFSGTVLPPYANVIPAVLPAADGAAALRIDFDAAENSQSWYRSLLAEVRNRLPPAVPLSIAVRASACGPAGWVKGLPVTEACPLLFRGPGTIDQPECQSSAGLWTGDHPPRVARLYWFHPVPWTAEAYARTVRR